MAKTKPFRVLHMDDEDPAVIRYDGDPDVFTALAWRHCIQEGIEQSVEPPEPRLYRCNPDFTGEYSWLLHPADKPGRGVWLGAKLKTATWFPDRYYRKRIEGAT
jgi:hypothetical protein